MQNNTIYIDVIIGLKNGVLDPQAKAIHNAINSLDFSNVSDVVVKKQIELAFSNTNKDSALKEAKRIAEELLANPVIEDYEIRFKG